MTTASKNAAIATWQNSLSGQADALAQKYSGPVLGSVMFADATRWWNIATKFNEQAGELSNITPERLKQAERNMLALLEFRSYAKHVPQDSNVSRVDAERAFELFTAPIRWLQDTGGTVLHSSVKLTEFIDDVKNAPSNALKWTLDQLFKSLGLPTWFGTAVVVTATAGVGWWAYQTFLKPTTRASRLLIPSYRNPGRRRRRRRKVLVAS